MHSARDYESHFNTELFAGLTEFEKRRKGIISKVIIAKVLNILTIMVFLSLFMGFLNAFPFEEFEMGIFIWIFEGFFYLVLSIVVFVIILKTIKYVLNLSGRKDLLKNKQKIYLTTAIIGILIILCAFYIGEFFLGIEIFTLKFFARYISAFFTIIILALLASFFSKYEKKFNHAIKREILPKILNFINRELKYKPDGFIMQSEFNESWIFPNKQIYRYSGSDFVSGSYGTGSFAFSQLQVKEIEKRRTGGKSDTKISELFKGLFYTADFIKSFKGKTFVYPDYAHTILGAQFGEMINHALRSESTQLVKFEDVNFEKEFAVYSTDQVEARFILSPSLIERIKLIKSKIGNDLYFSFIKNRVYIAIPGQTEFLCPIIFKDMTKFETIEPIYYGIEVLLEIANDLQLNTRIWADNN